MNSEFFNALDLLEKEKGIPKEYMMEKVTAALTSAFKRELGGTDNVKIVLDPNKKDMKVYQLLTVVAEVTADKRYKNVNLAKSVPNDEISH